MKNKGNNFFAFENTKIIIEWNRVEWIPSYYFQFSSREFLTHSAFVHSFIDDRRRSRARYYLNFIEDFSLRLRSSQQTHTEGEWRQKWSFSASDSSQFIEQSIPILKKLKLIS